MSKIYHLAADDSRAPIDPRTYAAAVHGRGGAPIAPVQITPGGGAPAGTRADDQEGNFFQRNKKALAITGGLLLLAGITFVIVKQTKKRRRK